MEGPCAEGQCGGVLCSPGPVGDLTSSDLGCKLRARSRSLPVRTRQTGDYLTIADGRGGMIRKSLKSFFVDQKIPRKERDRLPILAEDDHVLWVMGYRISEYYKVTENTKRILKVQLIRKEFA